MQRLRWIENALRRRDVETEPLRYVFVVSVGRSGSTLIQGVLNTLPRTLVRGENNLYILPLYRSMALASDYKDKFQAGSAQVTSAFYGLHEMRVDDFTDWTRDLVVRQVLGTVDRGTVDVVGFKEVHWHRIAAREHDNFFNFMDRAFPGVKYVLNWRNPDDTAGSGFWQGRSPDAFRHAVARTGEIHEYLRSTRPDRVFDTHYEVLTGDDDSAVEKQLRGLAEFVVGSCDDVLLSAMRETLSTGYGPNPFGASRGRKGKQAKQSKQAKQA